MSASLRGPSRTAVLTAVARAMHREEPPPWILDDTLALGLAGAEGAAIRDRLRAELPRDVLLGTPDPCPQLRQRAPPPGRRRSTSRVTAPEAGGP